jgi:hypothetical protein
MLGIRQLISVAATNQPCIMSRPTAYFNIYIHGYYMNIGTYHAL